MYLWWLMLHHGYIDCDWCLMMDIDAYRWWLIIMMGWCGYCWFSIVINGCFTHGEWMLHVAALILCPQSVAGWWFSTSFSETTNQKTSSLFVICPCQSLSLRKTREASPAGGHWFSCRQIHGIRSLWSPRVIRNHLRFWRCERSGSKTVSDAWLPGDEKWLMIIDDNSRYDFGPMNERTNVWPEWSFRHRSGIAWQGNCPLKERPCSSASLPQLSHMQERFTAGSPLMMMMVAN